MTAEPTPTALLTEPCGTMLKTHEVGVDGDACGQAGSLPADSSTRAPALGVHHGARHRALEGPELVERGGVVGGVRRIEALAGGLADPHGAAGDHVEVLHAAAQAVRRIGQHRADGGGAVRAPRRQVVVGALVVDGAVGPDGVTRARSRAGAARPTSPGLTVYTLTVLPRVTETKTEPFAAASATRSLFELFAVGTEGIVHCPSWFPLWRL